MAEIMGKIQNTFIKGTVNKDVDSRFLDSNEMSDAENFLVTTSEGDGGGVGKNALGNVERTTLAYTNEALEVLDFSGAKTIGSGKNENGNKIYNFIKSTLYDAIVEYDTEEMTSEFLAISSAGGVLNFTSERITNVDVIINGENGSELLAWSGDGNPPRIASIAWMKTLDMDDFTEDEISLMKPAPIFAPEIAMTNTISILENDNFIEDKFIRFAYRYKYRDGYYSAPSSWSEVAFKPKPFELDYHTYDNLGMVNQYNAVDVTFNSGPREVKEVELLFKETDRNEIYVAYNFVKANESWADGTDYGFQFSKSKIFKLLSSEQTTRNFDNVPLQATAQTTIMGRLAYGNYLEGRDIDTDIDFDAELVTTSPYIGIVDTDIEDYNTGFLYSNVVDFERKLLVTGDASADTMDFSTNTFELFGMLSFLEITVTPLAGYESAVYDVTIKSGSTVLHSDTGLTGTDTVAYAPLTGTSNVSVFVTSVNGMQYDCVMEHRLFNGVATLSVYNFYADYQLALGSLSYPYPSSLQGGIVSKGRVAIDFTGYEFSKGKQMRINWNMVSSLVDDMPTPPSVSFFYEISEDYDDLADFMANSSFKQEIEGTFSDVFLTPGIGFASFKGPIVSSIDFKVSSLGDTVYIGNPSVVYTVTEPSGSVNDKREFFLNTSVVFEALTEGSFESHHSNRDYQHCLFYLDDKGRKTTALVSKNNTYNIPAGNSVTVNKSKITLNHAPPSWAKYYKFGVKCTKTDYEVLYGNIVYQDLVHRWIKLEGENKSKVKEGDLLTVKSDFKGPLSTLEKAKVLEVAVKEQDFIIGNVNGDGKDIVEEPGLYFKIKQGNFDINVTDDMFRTYHGSAKRRYASRSYVTTGPVFGDIDETTSVFTPHKVNAGSHINFYVSMKAYGQIAFEHRFEKNMVAMKNYDSIGEWFADEIEDLPEWERYLEHPDYMTVPTPIEWHFDYDAPTGKASQFNIKPWRDGTASRDIMTDVNFSIAFAGGNLVFETEAFEDLSAPFFETPEVYNIIDGEHEMEEHILDGAYNCYAFGNGVESYKIRDVIIGKSMKMDANPSEVEKEGYRQIRRFADITYGGTYNSNSNTNRLNEFNLSTANFKDDLEKNYGAIYKLKGGDDLQVFQESKDSQVLFGKDVLFNADGSSNLSKISNVLGQQIVYAGDYGISSHPDSMDTYGFNTYHTDVRRGVVLKKANNGLFEVSSQGMRSYFKTLFANNSITQVNGKYDSYNDFYVLNIQYIEPGDFTTKFVTWVYSDKDNGWLGRINFNPEDMISLNGKFFAFKNGKVYEHNQTDAYNTFFGVESPSTCTMNFSQNPSERKQYKTFEIEGTVPVDIEAVTDMGQGYVNKEDFDKVENVYYGYIRTSDAVVDTSLSSAQGIGSTGSVFGNTILFDFDVDLAISAGDVILNSNMEVVGTVLFYYPNQIVFDSDAENVTDGDYVLCVKPQSVENPHLLGYHCQATLSFSSTEKQEIYAINSEVSKSMY